MLRFKFIFCVCLCVSQRTLHHGNEVVLYSRSSGKTLRINENKVVEGRGGEGPHGTYTHSTCV